VPDEVDIVEVLADRFRGLDPTAGSTDRVETGVDASYVLAQLVPR